MTITLYKNNQHEADSPDLIYQNKWAISPYEPSNMFCNGETVEQKDFILPPGITFNGADVALSGFRYHNKSPGVLSTNDKGQPVLTFDYMPPFVLLTQEEKSQMPQPIKPATKVWVPGYDKNGELEIF